MSSDKSKNGKRLKEELGDDQMQAATLTLVGHYMQNWALMEAELNEALFAAMRTRPVTSVVIARNTFLRTKISILRSLVGLLPIEPAGAAALEKLLKRIEKLSGDRNMVAHDVFLPHPKGVQFLVVKARGRVDVTTVIWTPKDFKTRCLELQEIRQDLNCVPEGIKDAQKALSKYEDPPSEG